MIEIILRDDINAYEPKPLFGFTYRQVATGAAVAAACGGLGVLAWQLGLPDSLASTLILFVGAAIGFLGVGRVDDLRATDWVRVAWDDQSWPADALPAPVVLPGQPTFKAGGVSTRPERRRRRRVAAMPELDLLAAPSPAGTQTAPPPVTREEGDELPVIPRGPVIPKSPMGGPTETDETEAWWPDELPLPATQDEAAPEVTSVLPREEDAIEEPDDAPSWSLRRPGDPSTSAQPGSEWPLDVPSGAPAGPDGPAPVAPAGVAAGEGVPADAASLPGLVPAEAVSNEGHATDAPAAPAPPDPRREAGASTRQRLVLGRVVRPTWGRVVPHARQAQKLTHVQEPTERGSYER